MFAGFHQQRLPEDESCLFYYFNYSCQYYQKPKISYRQLTAIISYVLRIDFFFSLPNTVLARPFQDRRYDFAIEWNYSFSAFYTSSWSFSLLRVWFLYMYVSIRRRCYLFHMILDNCFRVHLTAASTVICRWQVNQITVILI